MHLQRGYWVILDRYIASGLAYAIAKGVDSSWASHPDEGLPHPFKTFLLTPSEGCKREDFGEEVHDDTVFQRKVQNAFLEMARSSPNNWEIIERGSKKEVFQRIKKSLSL